jgi:large subunit ribosomal protein L9
MDIILKETIDTLGLEGDIVNVKPGYARNYLIPQEKAVSVNKATLSRLKHEQQAINDRRDIEQRKAEALATKLEAKIITMTRRVGSEGRLFGSVGTKDIAQQLAENGITIDRRTIMLPDPIKHMGSCKVTVKVGYQLTTQITVHVKGEGVEEVIEEKIVAPVEEVEVEVNAEIETPAED